MDRSVIDSPVMSEIVFVVEEDPEGEFDFQAFSDPVEVVASQMTIFDIGL